ncbi:MDR family MFS transporter [Priestia taiwanensis]|uniref:MFS transporter n=1 Tax=Priestia taiwanensis TaxID=1347902 RepID=A0A917ELL0_9BACI|nr:MFS transporter [Priestia taiwanensis]MBM7362226.1 MFS family permease [Priestia taiwanensis]GGE60463.1 MFS transporter [Priestia taiwanensis]
MIHKWIDRYNELIWIRLVGELLTSTTGAMIAPFIVLFLHDKLDGNILLAMIIVAMQPLSEIILTLLGGTMTDRIGRKKIILVALFLQAMAMTGFIFAESVWLFAGMYLLNGMGRALYIPASRAQIADSVESSKRSEVFALINTVGAIGFSIGPIIGYFVFTTDPSLLFACEAIALILYFFVVLVKLPETAPEYKRDTHTPRSVITWKERIVTHRYVLGLMAFSLPISFFYAQKESTYPLYMKEMFSDYLLILTTIATVKAILDIVFQFVLTKWAERFSMKNITLITYSCYILAALGYGYSSSLWMLLCIQVILVIAESIGLNHFLRFVSELAPVTLRGTYFSIYGTHWDISRMIGPFTGGMILVDLGGLALFYLTATMLLIGCTAQYLLVRRIETKASIKTKVIST